MSEIRFVRDLGDVLEATAAARISGDRARTRRRRPRRRHANRVIVVVLAFVCFGSGIAVASGALSGRSPVIQQLPGTPKIRVPNWPKNANGQTYGWEVGSSADDPDLIGVIATNGKTGYAYWSQLNPPGPTSPAAALAEQAANTKAQYIPVYTQDGTTVIGRFEIAEPGHVAG